MSKPSLFSAVSRPYATNSQAKDPWLAVNLSMFFPGLGQWYANKNQKATLLAIAQVILIIVTIWSIFSHNGHVSWGLGGIVALVIVYISNIFDAHWTVYYSRQNNSLEKIPRQQKNPWFAVFANRIIPGLGQLYADKVILGIIFLTISLITLKIDDFLDNILFLTPLITAIAVYHVYHTFPDQFHPHRHTYRSILALMVAAIFTWGIICNYFPDWLHQRIEFFEIPSESMLPTLAVGDRILTPEKIQQLEPNSGDFFIKRVIAISGDTIEIRRGKVYLNWQVIEEPYTAELANYEIEFMTVPPKTLFVLGDNRNHSFDSHAWGFLPESYIVGQAYKVYWPLDRVQSLL
ncbi:MAG: signal peptidase I [Microcystis aeruginosa Ma_AC_P_19900807_S299]|nr:MAG: signal peptidase I [Microcystis aeruginosa Ma_AC_P_19900807_S299]